MENRDVEPTPATPRDFNDELEQLVRAAVENGVEVEGAWVAETDTVASEVEIHITEVE